MPGASLYINQIDTDQEFYVWGSGNNLSRFNGENWENYDYTNSAVPSNFFGAYYLDTRCLSIDPEDIVWCGVAQGPTAGLSDVAVFSLNTNDVFEGQSWLFSDLGDFNNIAQEISSIYASPFGSEVLAFSTPLNGIGGTGATVYTAFNGVTGGRLFYFQIYSGKWKETAPGFSWPHIYDIKAKGLDGYRYLYYVATEQGLYEIPPGTLETISTNLGGQIIKQAQIFNTSTSGIISDKIYCLDLDENFNIWIGTDVGLSYFDGTGFWNYGTSGPVTSIQSRPNGHVFYSLGDGEMNQGTGLWHFNGTTHTQFTPSNSSLSDLNVLDINLIGHNVQQSDLLATENSLWILGYNNISLFEYDIPHVYASSNYAGATGWDFVYYSPTGSTGAPLPKLNKYTWNYPEWRIYQDEYLAEKFPGLDPRNLFLTTSLKEIANGRAGKQPWWNDYPIPSWDQEKEIESFISPSWLSNVEIYQGTSGATGSGVFFESQSILNVNGSKKLYVGGHIKGNVTVKLGYYNDSTPALLTNKNPTFCGTAQSDRSSSDLISMGFVVCYNQYGQVESFVDFPGYQTRINSVTPSRDNNSIFVSGSFELFLENGPYIFTGFPFPGTTGDSIILGGITGAPMGLTTDLYSGATSGDFPGIYGSTGGNLNIPLFYGSGSGSTSGVIYTYSQGSTASAPGLCDFNNIYSPATNYEDIFTVRLNYADGAFTWFELGYSQIPTGSIMFIEDSSSPVNYSYFFVKKIYLNESAGVFDSSPQTANFDVIYCGGSGSQIIPASPLRFSFVNYLTSVFPLFPGGYDYYVNSVLQNSFYPGFFTAQIDKDLGDITSFSGLTGPNFSKEIDLGYKILNFRYFPTGLQNSGYFFENSYLFCDPSETLLNLGGFVPIDPISGDAGSLYTLKNGWSRNLDLPWTSERIQDPLMDFSSPPATPGVSFYINLGIEDFSLNVTTNSSVLTAVNSDYRITSINSLSTNNTTLFTGLASSSFEFGEIDIYNGVTGTTGPFYLIVDSLGLGVTGGFITNFTDVEIPILSSKTESTYFVTTITGASGFYFGEYFTAGSTGTYFLTAEITEQGVSKNIFAPKLDVISGNQQNVINLFGQKVLPNGLVVYAYQSSVDPYVNVFKSDQSGRITDKIDFGLLNCEPSSFSLTFDDESNVYIGGFNATGSTGDSFITCGPTSAFVLQSENYNFEPGINLGNIISRPGSGAWTWCDVHQSENYLEIPLMSTVIFSNYNSSIYGKYNNTWSLIDSATGNDLLTVRLTPYFIYTFTEPGFYTLYNQVEDSQGNVYEVSKPGFIQIKDHKIKDPDDPRPNFVDSRDYGFPDPPFENRDIQANRVAKQLEIDEAQILKDGVQPFGSSLIIPDDPDATFRDLSDNTVE